MVSTHAWKATVSSPPPAASTLGGTGQAASSLFSPGAASPFAAGTAPSATGGMGLGGTPSSSATLRPFIGGSDHKPPGATAAGATGAAGGPVADFSSLLASSSSLLSSMGRGPAGLSRAAHAPSGGVGGAASSTSTHAAPGVTLGDKSLVELSVASRVAAAAGPTFGTTGGTGGGSSSTTYEAEASAHRLLAREGWGFDSARLGRTARELERRANAATASGYGGGRMEEENMELHPASYGTGAGGGWGAEAHPLTSLQGSSLRQILDGHHHQCVERAVRQAREASARQARERIDARLRSDWERERHEILGRGVPGSRFLLGGTGSGGGMGEGGGVASRVPLLEGDATVLAIGVAPSSSPYTDIVPSPQTMPAEAEGLIKSHLASVDKHLTATAGGAGSTALLASLQEGLTDAAVVNTGLNPEALTGYSNALSLIKSIATCNATLGVDASSDKDLIVASGVVGACGFFAEQFATHARETVREAELAGVHATSTANNALSSGARDICAFASLSAGRDVVEGNGGVWPRLFYCLRCGSLTAAKSVLDRFGRAGSSGEDMSLVDPAVASVVSQLATMQQTRETIFGDKSLLHPSAALVQSRRQVSDLYERAKTQPPSSAAADPCLPYRTACLAMLGGAESISEATALASSGLVATVEDYLYGSLWHAVHLAEGSSSAMTASGQGVRQAAAAVARLSVLVQRWGPAYFEREEEGSGTSAAAAVARAARGGAGGTGGERAVPPSGGWAYTLPLLATQQYATALAYLAEAGGGLGLLQAAHVGVVMDAAGLSIGDFGLEESASSKQDALLPMVVASYSASLQGVDAIAALKYLVLLEDKGKFIKEQVERLLLETRQFDALAGKVQQDGSRSNGALDAHFSRKEVSSLLVDAANQAIRTGKPADAAELLVLSGRFGALFELMNRELASYLNASTPEDISKRQFWFSAASQFHTIHLSNGRSYVQSALDAEGCMSLGNTFQLLMNLVVFFDRCRDNQWDGAWALMDNLALLPRSEAEMTVKVEAYRELDGCVRRVFHHVVLAAMEALCHIYRNLKQDGGAGVGGADRHSAIDQSLNELRNRSRLLVTFARLLNLPSMGDADTYVRISQLEKNMM